MTTLRRLIPSMFHRRLLLLLLVFFCGSAVLSSRLFWLTVVRGRELRSEAERVLTTRRFIDTQRGRILDAKGRILAEDRPCSDIAVDYDVITGEWAYQQARRLAFRDHRETWGEMSFDRREALIEGYQEPFNVKLEELWDTMARLGGIERAELERRKATLINRVQMIREDVWRRRAHRRSERLGEPVDLKQVAIPIAEEYDAHTLLPAVSDEVAYAFRKRAKELPGLKVVRSKSRRYPRRRIEVELDRSHLPSPLRSEKPMSITVRSVGGHLIGGIDEVQAEDFQSGAQPKAVPFRTPGEAPDLGGYLPGDMIGQSGVEASEEARLRGVRGQKVIQQDTGEEERQEPRSGRDVHLTVDIALQARIRAIMDPSFGLMRVQPWHGNDGVPLGTPLYGAAVVMEVDTGNLLALVSTPMPPPRVKGEPYPDLATHPDRPLVNKPVAAVYPPGSTLKPIVYTIAAAKGAITRDEVITCEGHLLENLPNHYKCWGWRPKKGMYYTHGPLNPVGAIARSCNIYFYTCGQRLGAERLVANLRQWGFDRSTPLGLPAADHVSGILPYLDRPNPPGRRLKQSNAIMMGIGQGPIAVPPLQIAAAHAALARGGYYLSPILIREEAHNQIDRNLDAPPLVLENALQGMYEAANNVDHGTANHIYVDNRREPFLNVKNVTIRGKTGTAQAANQYALVRRDGKLVPDRDKLLRSGTHSWYVAHVQEPGRGRASYIVAVMVEYGGSGGRVSGPVANQIIHALQDEGYLSSTSGTG